MELEKAVAIKRFVLDGILSYAQMHYPKEAILLLHGKAEKRRIIIDDLQIPPLATHGASFSNFPLHMLPIDFSIVGTAHSHPSGVLKPSIGDLNHFYGKIMIITAYPYQSEQNLAVFDRNGNRLKYEIINSNGT